MTKYRIRAGKQLPHDGQLLEAGAVVDLPPHVGADPVVRDFVEEIDAAGNLVLAPLSNAHERFLPHEQVTLLEASLAEAYARVELLESQIAAAKAASAARQPVAGVAPLSAVQTPNVDHDEE